MRTRSRNCSCLFRAWFEILLHHAQLLRSMGLGVALRNEAFLQKQEFSRQQDGSHESFINANLDRRIVGAFTRSHMPLHAKLYM